MSQELRLEYLKAIRERYKNSGRSKKSLILDEFCTVCGYSRKYGIAILAGRVEPLARRPRGRHIVYNKEVVYHLVRLWRESGMLGSTKFRAALPEWLEYDEHPAMRQDQALRDKVLQISKAQLDRLLRPYRFDFVRGISSTRPGHKRIKNQIPIQAKDWNITAPGQQLQADTVAHCGDSLSGHFANSLTVTDIYSAWTENRALWGKSSARVIEAMKDVEKSLPFEMKGFKSDSGSEFMNYELMAYFKERSPEKVIQMTRSRPYKKDDNCYVEQKNFTHVRELFGYMRMDDPMLAVRMNEIYIESWGPLQNFFIPTQKLLRKTRVGARIKKEYEPAKTPYQRLMESENLTELQKQALRNRKSQLNPFELQKNLQKKLREFEEELRQRNTGQIAAGIP
jgi:hypothetical protein